MFKSIDALNASCNAVTRLVDLGSTYSAGRLDIYDFTNTVLVQLPLSLPAFADSTDGTAVSNIISDAIAIYDGTAMSFGVLNRDASTVWTGTVSGYSGSGDLKLDSTYIPADSTVAITDMVYIVPSEFTYFGATGLQGATGIGSGGGGGTGIGTPGATGIQGVTGPFGGPAGETGIQGLQGSTGILGRTGIQGVTGFGFGVTGLQGSQGGTGVVGAVGATGIIGPAGLTGSPGVQGITGVIGIVGNPGITGVQGLPGLGATGIQGLVGPAGSQGVTGLIGRTGLEGIGTTGIQGPAGPAGAQGVTGLRGATGLGSTGIQGQTGLGIQGATGILGLTGLQGVPGVTGVGGTGGGSSLSFGMAVSRYQMTSGAGEEVWCVSASTSFSNLAWTRSGTTLTINRNSHGHAVGNRVIVRNTNVDYQVALVATIATNSFTITTSNGGGTSGSEGTYSLGFTYTHNGSPITGGTLSAPSGDHADCQLLSLKITTGVRASTTYDVAVPASAINGAGENTDLDGSFIPDYSVRGYADTLTAIGASIAVNAGGAGYSTYQFGNLTASLVRIIILHF